MSAILAEVSGGNVATGNFDLEGSVRKCRGGAHKEGVQCAIEATSLDALAKCDGWKDFNGSAGSGK